MFGRWSVGGIIALIVVGFIVLAILTHPHGFSSAAGTLFTGANGLGETLSGTSREQNSRAGGHSRASRMAFAA